jgi:hypothetical protein
MPFREGKDLSYFYGMKMKLSRRKRDHFSSKLKITSFVREYSIGKAILRLLIYNYLLKEIILNDYLEKKSLIE